MIWKPLSAEHPAQEAIAASCIKAVRVNGKKTRDAVSVSPPNVVTLFRRDSSGRLVKDAGGRLMLETRRASSIELVWRHDPCDVCSGYREAEL